MGHYGESHESGRAFIADGMEVKKLDDVPMGAMWTQPLGVHRELYGYDADDRESASVAHIYGQNLAAAESMTARIDSAWAWSPATLKPTADQELLNGINRIVIHESAHQPLVGPGNGTGLDAGARMGSGSTAMKPGQRKPVPGSITLRAAAICCSRAASLPISSITTARIRT